MTVGQLIEELSKHDKNKRVTVSRYESCMTDSGTDMGDDVEKSITRLFDLESRIVIESN